MLDVILLREDDAFDDLFRIEIDVNRQELS